MIAGSPSSPDARARALSGLLAIVCITGLVAAGSASAKPGNGPLKRAMQHLVDRTDGPPGAIAIVHRPGGDVKVFRAGTSKVGTNHKLRRRARMRLASFAKALSGATALHLVQEGRLSLDDTLAERLPKLPAKWGAVTLRQLLNHTSGLPDFTEEDDFRTSFLASPEDAPPPRDLLKFAYDEDLNFVPGTEYRYSNSDNIAVGLMVQKVAGRNYAQVLRNEVTRPLGLTRTSLPRGAQLTKPYIHGYDIDPPAPPDDYSEIAAGGWAWASGGVVSTPNDLDRFVRAYLHRRFFDGSVQAEQLDLVPGGSSDPRGPGANAAGLGIFRYRTRCGTVYGHTGNIFGYTQLAAANRTGNRSVTFSITRQYDSALLSELRRVETLAVCAALRR